MYVLLMQDILQFSLNCVIFTILPIISYISYKTITRNERQEEFFYIIYTCISTPDPHQHSQ